MTPPYTVDYFIQKFEAIPEEKWTRLSFINQDRSCALGHCGVRTAYNNYSGIALTEEGDALRNLFNNHLDFDVMTVNDDCVCSAYPQPTPKARILAALTDIKKKQQTYEK